MKHMASKQKESCPDLSDRYFQVRCGGEDESLDSLVDGMQGTSGETRRVDGTYVTEGSYTIPPYDGHGYCGMI